MRKIKKPKKMDSEKYLTPSYTWISSMSFFIIAIDSLWPLIQSKLLLRLKIQSSSMMRLMFVYVLRSFEVKPK